MMSSRNAERELVNEKSIFQFTLNELIRIVTMTAAVMIALNLVTQN